MNRIVRLLAPLPGSLVALLPLGKCPACWPAYLGFLSAIGLGFLAQGNYLFFTVVGFIILVLATLAWKAGSRHGYGPLLLGLIGSVFLLVGKFHFQFNPIMYTGISFVVCASVWNSWPLKRVEAHVKINEETQPLCPHCHPKKTDKEGE